MPTEAAIASIVEVNLRFFRNKDIKILTFVMILVTLAGTITGFLFSPAAGLTVLATSVLMCTGFLVYLYWRYRQIDRLSNYLRNLSRGDYVLDIRDNSEGELSILKSEIYKVTVMLSEQAELLRRDKIHLADSISDISHQIKTPLTSMFLMTELLGNDKLPPDKRKEFTDKIYSQLERLQWLVSSLLKLSKLDADTITFKPESVSIEALISKSLTPLLIPMELKEHALKVDGDKEARIICDLNWTVEALVNVLKNCIEHTPVGGRIDIAFSETMLYCEIIIKDNGSGISKTDLPNIFKRFYKGKNAGDDSVGIGLAMANSIISKQNGTISVKSELGEGTEFVIRIYKDAKAEKAILMQK